MKTIINRLIFIQININVSSLYSIAILCGGLFTTVLNGAETNRCQAETSLADLREFASFIATDWIRVHGVDAIGTNAVLQPFRNITGELNSSGLKQLISHRLGVEISVLKNVEFSLSAWARDLHTTSPSDMNHDVRDGIKKIAESYVRSRLTFHSSEYAIASLEEAQCFQTNILSKPQIAVLQHYPTVPPSWLKSIEAGSTFRSGCPNYIYYGISDNGIMWLYKVDKNYESVDCERFDAQEFDTALAETFKKCREEAERRAMEISRDRGLSAPTSGLFWGAMQNCLAAHGIKWKMPSWLNPDRIYD